MKLTSRQLIDRTVKFVQDFFRKEGTGHDWWHTYRVKNLSLKIAAEVGADHFIVEMSALLHDIGDYKFFNGNEEKGQELLGQFLNSLYLPSRIICQILDITSHVSYMKSLSKEKYLPSKVKTPEFMAVNDADRLDAIGAIGIARTFTFGGYHHRPIYDPCLPPTPDISREEYKITEGPSINHFYEKLLKLKDTMYTSYGKKLACDRHRFLEIYLERFYAEWEGEK